MPDYNPAVASGIQPPQSPNWAGTLGTVANIQAEQARTNLYTLQAMQQQRQYGALQDTAAYIRNNPGDVRGALLTYTGRGGDPAGAPSIVNSLATANATATTPGNMLPSEWSQRMTGLKTAAEIPGTRADADRKVAETYGPGVLLNPSDDGAYSQLVNAHFDAAGEQPGQRAAALAIKDPSQRQRAAIGYGTAAGVPLDKLTQVFGPGGPAAGDTGVDDYNNKNLTPAQRVGAAPILRQPGEVKRIEEYTAQNTKDLNEANTQYRNANVAQFRLGDLRKNLNNLGGLLAPGAGFNERVALARGLDTAGINIGFTKDQLAAAQASVKGSTYLGFDLAKTLGSREAAMIVQQSIGIQPGGQMTAGGNKRVWASLSVANQYNKDHATFVREYLKQNPNAVPGDADAAFNQVHPVSSYISDVDKVVKIQGDKNKSGGYLVDDLSAGKGSAKEFDEHYGGNYSRYFGK